MMAEVLVFAADYLRDLGRRLFAAGGAPADEAAMVADELVEASLMGLDSHGVMRFKQYLDAAAEGSIRPGAPTSILKESPTTALVDCGFNFGPVSAARMTQIAARKAKVSNLACVVSRNSHHVGRLGSYVQKLAAEGLIGLATANSSKHGHFVAPWGGSQGRLATNPLAYAVPTSGDPIVLDMSTSMIAEGKIRVLLASEKSIPPGCVRDAAGNPVTDPKDFYGPPRGTIQPLGGELGYKGFGLGLLVEILGAILAGQDSSLDLPYINGLCLVAIDPEAFCGRDLFRSLADNLCRYVTSCPPAPGFAEVIVPGTLDFRTRRRRLAEGIPLPETTWENIVECAHRLGVSVSPPGVSGLSP
jgi:uncharacterized oxidoreductase